MQVQIQLHPMQVGIKANAPSVRLTRKSAHGILLHPHHLVCCSLHCQAAADLSRAASIHNGVVTHLHTNTKTTTAHTQHVVRTYLNYLQVTMWQPMQKVS
jgi:hypothetical protein